MAGNPIPAAGQIWFLDRPPLGNSQHGHFALVTEILTQQQKVTINFIATDSTSYDDFWISDLAPEFEKTGLRHSSHLLRNSSRRISFSMLLGGRYKGLLTGRLKDEIEEWWGVKL